MCGLSVSKQPVDGQISMPTATSAASPIANWPDRWTTARCHDVMTAANLLRHLLQNSTRVRMSFIREVDHRSPMIVVADRSDEADDGAGPGMGHDLLKVSQADRVANDVGEDDTAGVDAVAHSDISPHCLSIVVTSTMAHLRISSRTRPRVVASPEGPTGVRARSAEERTG